MQVRDSRSAQWRTSQTRSSGFEQDFANPLEHAVSATVECDAADGERVHVADFRLLRLRHKPAMRMSETKAEAGRHVLDKLQHALDGIVRVCRPNQRGPWC